MTTPAKPARVASVVDEINRLMAKVDDYTDSRILVILRRTDFDALRAALPRAEALEALVEPAQDAANRADYVLPGDKAARSLMYAVKFLRAALRHVREAS